MGRACKTYRPRPICSAQRTKNHLPLGMGSVNCKEDGIVAGLQVFQRVFQLLDPKTEVVFDVQDGETVQKGQHMATVVGTKTTLLDTRKTTPCMRIFEKYAVTVGGGSNHICTNFGYKFEAFEGIGGIIYDERSRTQKEN